jgi:Bacterial regulatory proteins, lacI family
LRPFLIHLIVAFAENPWQVWVDFGPFFIHVQQHLRIAIGFAPQLVPFSRGERRFPVSVRGHPMAHTMSEVAARAGVSKATVSRALNRTRGGSSLAIRVVALGSVASGCPCARRLVHSGRANHLTPEVSVRVCGGGILPALSRRLSLSQPDVKFPSEPKARIAVSSYSFRAFIAGEEHRSGNPTVELKDFAAHVARQFGVHNVEPWSAQLSAAAWRSTETPSFQISDGTDSRVRRSFAPYPWSPYSIVETPLTEWMPRRANNWNRCLPKLEIASGCSAPRKLANCFRVVRQLVLPGYPKNSM